MGLPAGSTTREMFWLRYRLMRRAGTIKDILLFLPRM